MVRSLIAPIAAACTLFCAAQAGAQTVTINNFATGFEQIEAVLATPNVAFDEVLPAGGFSTSVGAQSFTTYCADIYTMLDFGVPYNDYTTSTSANTDLAKLYGEGNTVNSALTSAAFQVAVWEILYGTPGAYDVSSGPAQFKSATTEGTQAIALAQTWLNNLSAAPADAFTVEMLSSANEQSQVYAVPEPSSYALMLAGLTSIGFVARRRAPKR